jgi:hypothetical protein
MSVVIYNGNRIIPAPLVTSTKSYQFAGDNTKIGTEWNITIQGTIIAWMGSPNSQGVWWNSGGTTFPPNENIPDASMFASILRKQEYIRELFSVDGKELEFQSNDGSAPMKCNPRIISITFNEGTWYDRLTYSITCISPTLSVLGQDNGEDAAINAQYIESAEESWSLETVEEPESEYLSRIYKISHTVSAKGKLVYNPDGTLLSAPWEQARIWVYPKLGFDATYMHSSGVTDLKPYYNSYNRIMSETIDKKGGGYSVTESWMLTSGVAMETYEVIAAQALDSALTHVSIDGTITGMEVRDPTTGMITTRKIDNALTQWQVASGLMYNRAMQYAMGANLNINPVTIQLTESPAIGVIKYNYQFDDRPSNLINKARLETISVTDNLPTDFIVPIFVLGRANGPVLQNLYTSRETTRTLNIECVMDKSYAPFTVNNNPRIGSNVQSVIDQCAPTGAVVGKQDNSETWDIKTGRYTFTRTWIWGN